MAVEIEAILTGRISLRPSLVAQPAQRGVWARRWRVLKDRNWSSRLPIYCFLLRHPEGTYLFDAGSSPLAEREDYFPWWHPFLRNAIDVRDTTGVGAALTERGLSPKEIAGVVLSHLHHDHSGGLTELPEVPVLMSAQHWASFRNNFQATIEGAMPQHWPKPFEPTQLTATGPPIGPWASSYPITSDGLISAVDTPGHTPGHLSLIVQGEGVSYLLPGDATYSIAALDAETPDGLCGAPKQAAESLQKIKEFSRLGSVVVLPSHDPQTPELLEQGSRYLPQD